MFHYPYTRLFLGVNKYNKILILYYTALRLPSTYIILQLYCKSHYCKPAESHIKCNNFCILHFYLPFNDCVFNLMIVDIYTDTCSFK